MNKNVNKAKLKVGDFVRVDPPMLGRIKRVYKDGTYEVFVFASPEFCVAKYDDKNVYKVSKKSSWVKESLSYVRKFGLVNSQKHSH